MRILLVNSFYFPNGNGGAEIVCRKLAEKLVERGHTVDVLTKDTYFHIDEINKVRVIYLNMYDRKSSCGGYFVKNLITKFYSVFDYFKLKKIIKKKYDIIHTHAIERFSPIVWSIAKENNIPIIHTMHDKYMICPRLFRLTRRNKECYNPHLICKFRNILYRVIAKNIACLVSPSHYLANCIPIKSVVIPNGVDFGISKDFQNEGEKHPFRYLFAGSMNPHKGLNYLLDAFHLMANENIELHIVGDGYYRERVNRMRLKDKRIHYYGWIDHERVIEIMRKCDCLICPSIVNENCPMAILEAFSVGLPVIGTNVGGIPEIITNNINGYVIEPRNVEELYKNMQRIILEHSRLQENLKKLSSKYDIDIMVRKYELLYYRTLKRCHHLI